MPKHGKESALCRLIEPVFGNAVKWRAHDLYGWRTGQSLKRDKKSEYLFNSQSQAQRRRSLNWLVVRLTGPDKDW